MSQPDDDISVDSDSLEAIMHKTRKVLKALSAESKRRTQNPQYPYMKGYVFGPFTPVTDNVISCVRCGFYVPSVQTGKSICTKTRWCEACTLMPPYVAHDLLRDCLEMRQEEDSTIGGDKP
jgi:hypothetical protein